MQYIVLWILICNCFIYSAHTPQITYTFCNEVFTNFVQEIQCNLAIVQYIEGKDENKCVKAFNELALIGSKNPVEYSLDTQHKINKFYKIIEESQFLRTCVNQAKIMRKHSEWQQACASIEKKIMERLQDKGKIIFPQLFASNIVLQQQPTMFLQANNRLKNAQYLYAWIIFKYMLQQDAYNNLMSYQST